MVLQRRNRAVCAVGGRPGRAGRQVRSLDRRDETKRTLQIMEQGGKRILFLSASFFGYQFAIKEQLEAEGYTVDYFDERPSNTFFVKALIRLNPAFLRQYIDQYYKDIIRVTADHTYDYIFIIKAEAISNHSLQKLRELHPGARFVLYLWDNFNNFVGGQKKLEYFDKILTFDIEDAPRYGLEFLPLFYLPEYSRIGGIPANPDIDILFIGTIHSDRYLFLQKIATQARSFSRSVYFYMFFMSQVLYYRMKLQDRAFRKVRKRNFQFKPLDRVLIIDLYKQSQAVIDIQHPKQTGLTMRSIETLGARRKLITTNILIRRYDFYDPANILVVDRTNPIISEEFLQTPYRPLPDEIYKKYSLESWVRTILK